MPAHLFFFATLARLRAASAGKCGKTGIGEVRYRFMR